MTSSSSPLPHGKGRAGDGADGPSDTRPHWDTLPIALLDGQRVRAATAGAGRARVGVGMLVTEARARCAELRIAAWDEDTIAREVTRATAAFVRASPQVTPAAGTAGTWWIGATGFASLGGERELGHRLLAIARRWHPAARVGIADSCVAARAATWANAGGEALIVVAPGECAAYLARAPLGIVPMDEELRDTLQALGLRTAGAFAALAGEDVERRWGTSGLAAWRLARGEDLRRPVLARLDAARAVAADLVPSAPTMEPILFLVRAALDRLVGDLVTDARAAAVVAITLTLDDARGAIPNGRQPHTITREIRLSQPLARTVPLFERCRALLDEWRLPAPACGVTVAITATAPLAGEQGELLDPAWRDPAAADAAFARLRATLGTSAIVRPILHDTHRPERAGAWERVDEPPRGTPLPDADAGEQPPGARIAQSLYARATAHGASGHAIPPDPAHDPAHGHPLALVRTMPASEPPLPSTSSRPSTLPPGRVTPVAPTLPTRPTPSAAPTLPYRPAFRQLDPPHQVEVQCDGEVPRIVHWGDRGVRIARATGPDRLTGDWWESPYARDYWRCEDTAGECELLLYRERPAPGEDRWFVQGWYD